MRGGAQVPWTDEERAMLRRLRANGLGAVRIGLLMGRSRHSVQRQIGYLGLVRQLPAAAPPKPAPPKRLRGRASLPPLPSLRGD